MYVAAMNEAADSEQQLRLLVAMEVGGGCWKLASTPKRADLPRIIARSNKMRMGATHFLMKRLPKVSTEMALHVLAYNLMRVMNIMGVQPFLEAMRA